MLAFGARLIEKYRSTFFNGRPVFPPPVRGRYGEAEMRLKLDPRVYQHQEFALRGDRKEAMEENLQDFIDRGRFKAFHSKWASPCLFVSKQVAREWRLVVHYHSLNAQMQHDSYPLPLIKSMLQKHFWRGS